jgi:N,N'-diacetyllegionaminate synthase
MKNKIIFVAEIGMNADGVFANNEKLIKAASYSGASIAKFQLGWRDDKSDINFLDHKRVKKIFEWGKKYNIEIMFSIIKPYAFDIIKKFKVKRFKIASRTVIEYPKLVKKILNEKKETFISLGWWKKNNFPFKNKNAKYLFCVSNYPTQHSDLKKMPKKFNNYFGYSDHVVGLEACFLAISRGANLIEKHFTLNKDSKVIRDHALSATPEEFKILVEHGHKIYQLNNEIS